MGPPIVVWVFPEPTWGQWPCHSFSYYLSVIITERDANAAFVLEYPGSEVGADDLVYECTVYGVMHLWLIVQDRPSADGMVQLCER